MKDGTKMGDLDRYIARRSKRDPAFARDFSEGYEKFKIGVLMKQARQSAGLTQEELARRIKTKKSAISRIENHAEDIKISTLERAALALGKKLQISLT
jgi:HTH-type transcriptional regulator/antitoxin HipB